MPTASRRFVLARRPDGALDESIFRLEPQTLPDPADGEVLVRTEWLSIDPYMRGRVSEARSYAPPVPLGGTMIGGGTGEVIASRAAGLPVGAKVLGFLGWQEHALQPAAELTRIDDRRIPAQAWLGAAGMPGVTAWVGLHEVARAAAGETVCVSAATGAVGAVVGQLARLAGCRAVGVAGGEEKCRFAVEQLGFAACVDHRAGELARRLGEAAPSGIDVYFDNVGGPVLDAVLPRMGKRARWSLTMNPSTRELQAKLADLIAGHTAIRPRWYPVRNLQGLERAPAALLDVLAGRNFGKQLVKVS